MKIGDSVKAGELLGYAALSDPNFDFDTDLERKMHAPNRAEILGSIFDHMTQKVLDAFAEHSISPEEMIIPLVQRQSSPCDFNSGKGRTTSDWVALKGEKIATSESSPQNNVLDTKKWESQDELRIAIVHWIEGTYHRRRRKRSLGKMTPVEYEVAHEVVDKELLVA